MRFPNYSIGCRQPVGATEYLRRDERSCAWLATANRMVELQKDCVEALPAHFKSCDVIKLENETLVLSVPNSALAARLKQVTPTLLDHLKHRGWSLSAVKGQVRLPLHQPVRTEQPSLKLSDAAVKSFYELGEQLPPGPANDSLIAALRALVGRRKKDFM